MEEGEREQWREEGEREEGSNITLEHNTGYQLSPGTPDWGSTS